MSDAREQAGGKQEGQPSFWQTAPGCISAIAALITALAGLFGVLYTTGVIGSSGDGGDPTEVARAATARSDTGGDSPGGATVIAPADPDEPTATDPPPLSFAEAVTGSYTLDSWLEAISPVTLFVEALDGRLDIQPSGVADWLVSIQQRGESVSPQPQIFCGGQVTFSEQRLNGVPGGDRNGTKDFTSDLNSIRPDLFLAFCGWNVNGEAAPFDLTLDTDGAGRKLLLMRNDAGTLRWVGS